MVELARRDLLLGGVLTGLGAGCFLLRPRRAFARLSDETLDRAIPKRFGPYIADSSADFILPPEDELSKKLYDKVVMRFYTAPDLLPVMALFAYGSTQNLTLQLHRPDECYPMQGFEITPLMPVAITGYGHAIPAKLVTASRPGRVEQVLFWSRIGNAFPPDRTQETIEVARENLRGRMPDGMLVRLSTITEDRAMAVAQMRSFSSELFAALPDMGRRVMFESGRAAVA